MRPGWGGGWCRGLRLSWYRTCSTAGGSPGWSSSGPAFPSGREWTCPPCRALPHTQHKDGSQEDIGQQVAPGYSPPPPPQPTSRRPFFSRSGWTHHEALSPVEPGLPGRTDRTEYQPSLCGRGTKPQSSGSQGGAPTPSAPVSPRGFLGMLILRPPESETRAGAQLWVLTRPSGRCPCVETLGHSSASLVVRLGCQLGPTARGALRRAAA